jgi:hypothetical protein
VVQAQVLFHLVHEGREVVLFGRQRAVAHGITRAG